MFHVGEGGQVALLKWKGRVWFWNPEGYGEGTWMDQGQAVEMLIPKPEMEVIGNGSIYLVLAPPALPNFLMENPLGPRNPRSLLSQHSSAFRFSLS